MTGDPANLTDLDAEIWRLWWQAYDLRPDGLNDAKVAALDARMRYLYQLECEMLIAANDDFLEIPEDDEWME